MEKEIIWNVSLLSHLNHRIDQCELDVQKIIYLQNIVNQLSDTFVDSKKVTKSHIVTTNVSSKIDIPTQHVITNEYETPQNVVDQ